jgi:outer membrane protein assembly factor BamB
MTAVLPPIARRLALALVIAASDCKQGSTPPIEVNPPAACNWTQWGHDAAHSGKGCVPGQQLRRALARVTNDPFVDQEMVDTDGELLARYQVPLLVGDDVYLEVKSGSYIPCLRDVNNEVLADAGTCGNAARDSLVRSEKRFHWEEGALVEKWTFASDWKPIPASLANFEPVFQSAVAGDAVYVPGGGGTVFELDRMSGAERKRHNPFGPSLDEGGYVVGGITVDGDGDVFYNAVKLDPNDPRADAQGFLIEITAAGAIAKVSYAALTPDAPPSTAECVGIFSVDAGFAQPFPPSPDDAGVTPSPPSAPCLSQRPAVNVTPAIGPDGTIFTVSTAHGNSRYGYLIAVHPDLTLKWTASLRDRLDDGCAVLIPADGEEDTSDAGSSPRLRHCRRGAREGVDPLTNDKPAAVLTSNSSSSPVVLPDGTVIYGAYTGYNTARGHLFQFDAEGRFLRTFDFGWDVTPAYFPHDGTYSIVSKDNQYYYWFSVPPVPLPTFDITRLDALLKKESSFRNTNTLSCQRAPDDSVRCADDGNHAGGFEWCINAPAVDVNGVAYANSEDGNLYAINPDGTEKGRFFLSLALGAAYTPLSIDYAGRIYAMNHGELVVVGE